ncbi:MAG: hypothetical protein SGJ02_11705 [bacterium]|nr:hypothetical protein [bacterium]
MSTPNATRNIKLGAISCYLGITSLGPLENKEVKIKADASLVSVENMSTGKGVVKVFTGGTKLTVELTLNHEHKANLQRAFQWFNGNNLDIANGDAGSYDFTGAVGKVVPPIVLSCFFNHFDDDGVFYGDDSANPHAVQLYRAVSMEAIEWAFSTNKQSTHVVVFEGQPDSTKPENSPGRYGFIALPGAGVFQYNVTAPGSGYTSAPAVAVGTQFAATTAYALNAQVAHLGNLYTATVAGTSGAIGTAPINLAGTSTSGTVTFTYAGISASAVAQILGAVVSRVTPARIGQGYTSAPAIVLTGGGGSGATVTSVIG